MRQRGSDIGVGAPPYEIVTKVEAPPHKIATNVGASPHTIVTIKGIITSKRRDNPRDLWKTQGT